VTIAPVDRSVRIPRLLRLVDGAAAAADALGELVHGSGAVLLVVHTGRRSGSGYAQTLIDAAARYGHALFDCVVDANTAASVDLVADRIINLHPAFVVGVGGGRVVDVAKLAAAQNETEFVSMPTQASSDGICSPVSVIVSDDGRPNSVGARIPAGIIVDMQVLRSAPLPTWRSGLGDLMSNISAVRDWRDAHERRGETIDDFACLTAEAAALSVAADDADLHDGDYQRKLVRGLILSGIAMEMAGSSRPASGGEHLISHALDIVLAQPRLHGLQVALATIATTLLRGDDHRRLAAFYRHVGLPVVPADLDIPVETFLRAVRLGPQMRVGRSTVLDDVDEADIARLRAAYSRADPRSIIERADAMRSLEEVGS